ncbi:Apoptosis regulator Bcl-2, partial [Stegodyphus mimosarum]
MTFRLTVPVNQMAIPIFATPPSREHVGLDGELLFEHFVQEELEHEGLSNPIPIGVTDPPINDLGTGEVVQNERVANGVYAQGIRQRMEQPVPPVLAGVPEGFNYEHLISIGANIRRLAEEFSRSEARRSVMEQAEQVNINALNQELFFQFLEEVFRNGIDRTRLVAVFFFCCDILRRCLRQNMMNLGWQLFTWSRQFVVDRICTWVYEHGGWERLFEKSYDVIIKIATVALAVTGVLCGIVYIKKNY